MALPFEPHALGPRARGPYRSGGIRRPPNLRGRLQQRGPLLVAPVRVPERPLPLHVQKCRDGSARPGDSGACQDVQILRCYEGGWPLRTRPVRLPLPLKTRLPTPRLLLPRLRTASMRSLTVHTPRKGRRAHGTAQYNMHARRRVRDGCGVSLRGLVRGAPADVRLYGPLDYRPC